MDGFKFNQRVKHGTLDFHPNVLYGFEDTDAAPYFKACGWGDEQTIRDGDDPVVITLGELDIDPLTVFGHDHDHLDRGRGQFVQPEKAAAHLQSKGHDVDEDWARDYVATFVPGSEILDHVRDVLKGEDK